MRQFQSKILLILIATLCLGQSSSERVTPEMRRVADKLACLCGSCKNTVSTCVMLGCHYSSPAKEKIASMQAAGKSDQEVVDSFVKEEGLRALSVPPAEGFNLAAWVMPFAALGMGLMVVIWFLRRNRKPAEALPRVDSAVLDRYHDQIEKDLAKLE